MPSIDVFVGYAVMVVDRQGRCRVEQGPKCLLLDYDETLEVLQMSMCRHAPPPHLSADARFRVACLRRRGRW